MPRLRDDAEAIWRAGVAAVDSAQLVRNAVDCDGETLRIASETIDRSRIGRIAVVGAGKAGAGMAAGLESVLAAWISPERMSGWVNVPADCLQPTRHIHLHAARPAGVNEPCEAGVAGAREILRIVSDLTGDDVCIVLLSGGGSALLPAPIPEITLAEKQTVTRLLMHGGANIEQLNCVRKQLSQIKGGGLARACSAGRTVTLIISDVIGDPLDVIASGPTVADASTPAEALEVLRKFVADPGEIPPPVIAYLESEAAARTRSIPANVTNSIIGNNGTALRAAAAQARALGYAVEELGSNNSGEARQVGRECALRMRELAARRPAVPHCLLWGGETTVKLVPADQPRKGGRNQEVALSAVATLWEEGMDGCALLSGGTDGEDGPTDAAGAFADDEVIRAAKSQSLTPQPFLAVNNAYHFFEPLGGLLKTGPTHTNVMDVAVMLVAAGS